MKSATSESLVRSKTSGTEPGSKRVSLRKEPLISSKTDNRRYKAKKLVELKQKELERQQIELKAKAEQELFERNKREKVLTDVTNYFSKAKSKFIKERIKLRNLDEWTMYTCYPELPLLTDPSKIRGYFNIWQDINNNATFEKICSDINIYCPLFQKMGEIVNEPLTVEKQTGKAILEVLIDWEKEFILKLDNACFYLILKMNKIFKVIDFYTREYFEDCEHVKLGIWALLKQPRKHNEFRKTPTIEFPNSKIVVSLPLPYNFKPIILRVMYVSFDFFSDSTKTKFQPENKYLTNLLLEVKRVHALKDKAAQKIAELEKENYNLIACEVESKSSLVCDETSSTTGRMHSSKESLLNKLSTLAKSSVMSVDSKYSKHRKSGSLISQWTNASIGSKFIPKSPFRFDKSNGLRQFWEQIYGGKHLSRTSLVSKRISKVSTDSVIQTEKFLFNDVDSPDAEIQQLTQTKSTYRNQPPDNLCDLVNDGPPEISEYKMLFIDFLCEEERKKKIDVSAYEITSLCDLIKASNIKEPPDSTENYEREKTVSQLFNKYEEDYFAEFVNSMIAQVEPWELNMRKFTVIGGIYFVDLIKPPFSFWQLKNGDLLHIQIGPYQINGEKFMVKYEPSPITSEILTNSEEENKEIENEKLHHTISDLNDLISVEIGLMNNVFWFDTPKPVMWVAEKNIWSDEFVYDVHYDKEQHQIKCKLGKHGPIAMSVFRFCQLPFKNWLLTPLDEQVALLRLECQYICIEFHIGIGQICLNKIENYEEGILDNIIGEYFSPDELFKKMKSVGLDIFPEDDTFIYVEGCSGKPLGLEDHVYLSFAMFAKTLEFAASSWNLALGPTAVAFQCRVHSSETHISFRTFKITTLRAEMLLFEDVADQYSDLINKDLGFVPDSYTLLTKLFSKYVANITSADIPLILTVYHVLIKTRVLTFSGSTTKEIP